MELHLSMGPVLQPGNTLHCEAQQLAFVDVRLWGETDGRDASGACSAGMRARPQAWRA